MPVAINTLPSTLSVGSVSLTPPVDVTPTPTIIDTTTDFVVPAGAKVIQLENLGGLVPNVSTINGVNAAPGYKLEEKETYNGVERIQLAAYTIVTNGSRWVGVYLS